MSSKRILLVVNYFHPYVSGVSEYARYVATSLATQHEVTVLTCRHRAELPAQEERDGYTIIRADPLFFFDKGYISPAFIRTFRQLAKHCDVVNLHLPMLESGLLSFISSKPMLATYQCDMAMVGNLVNRLAVLGVRVSMRLALARAKSIVVLSEDYALSSPLAKSHRSKLVEISPPNRFENVSARLPARSSNIKTLICGFVGRFVREKGIETIIEAAQRLKHEPIEFWFAGDYQDVAGGSVYNQLKAGIETLGNKVRILGKVSDEELISFYNHIDVLLLPSTNRFEAFGMVQMEAMHFGAMVVTSDMPGVRETVRKTGFGQLCEPSSGASLADAILRARAERSTTSRDEIHEAIQRTFGNEKFTNRYLELFEKLDGR